MPEPKITKQELYGFSRTLVLLFNRATMYPVHHPYIKQSIDEFYLVIEQLLKSVSPLVFIMNREQLFIDEEPLDPRIIVSKIVEHFKKTEIQSISFENGLGKNETRAFLEIFTSLNKYPNADAMKSGLTAKGIRHLKINHVVFIKATEDDEVVSRDALKKLSPEITEDAQLRSKKLFMDMVLESVLAEEFEKVLTIENLMKNPAWLSKNMIEADLTSFRESKAEDRRPGPVLMHQLEVLNQEVEKNLSDNKDVNLSEMAAAIFDMKKQLIAAIETQKTLGIAYSNEEMILDKVNEIADNVLLQLVKDEYKAGEIPASRLAQILRRLVPEADELKRLLPKIKAALLKEGMPLSEYLELVQELGRELQSEELAKILQESAEEIGVDSESLIQEVKRDPVQAAELISLAAEIRKGTGDEKVLSDLLVDYIERMGSEATLDIAKEDGVEEKQHLRQVITDIESGIVGRLRNMDIKDDVLDRLEERLNDRMDEVLEKVKMDMIHSQSGLPEKDGRTGLSVLQILEQNVGESEELGEILETVRAKAQSEDIDEDDFRQIYAEITKQQEKREKQEEQKKMPAGVLKAQTLTVFIEKEISRAKRYGTPFAALAFSLVKAKPKTEAPSSPVTHQALINEILKKLSTIVRDADIVGEFGKNEMVVLLTNTLLRGAEKALRRCLKLLYLEPIEVNGTPLTIKMAGIATKFDVVHMPDAKAFVEALSNKLMEMEIRIKNIQTLF